MRTLVKSLVVSVGIVVQTTSVNWRNDALLFMILLCGNEVGIDGSIVRSCCLVALKPKPGDGRQKGQWRGDPNLAHACVLAEALATSFYR